MLSPYGIRHARKLTASQVYSLYLELDVLTVSPLLFPSFLLWNPETLSSGLDLSVKVEAELDLGNAVTDDLNSGLFTVTVLPTTSVPAGTFKLVDINALTLRWLQTYVGASPNWKVRHKLTITNLNITDPTRLQLLVDGFVEETVDQTRRPLFSLTKE